MRPGRAGDPHVKVCGATTAADVALLAAGGVDLVGLWHGVPDGPAEVDLATLGELADAARAADVEPVLVTFLRDAAAIAEVLATTGIAWVQLHGYQPPPLLRELRAGLRSVVLVKVLHVAGVRCVEQRFVPAYARAGADLFLLDAVGAGGRVGSTGRRIPLAAALDLAADLPQPFLLAGGITPDAGGLTPVLSHPRCAGIDVDGGARDARGEFDATRVRALVDLAGGVRR